MFVMFKMYLWVLRFTCECALASGGLPVGVCAAASSLTFHFEMVHRKTPEAIASAKKVSDSN